MYSRSIFIENFQYEQYIDWAIYCQYIAQYIARAISISISILNFQKLQYQYWVFEYCNININIENQIDLYPLGRRTPLYDMSILFDSNHESLKTILTMAAPKTQWSISTIVFLAFSRVNEEQFPWMINEQFSTFRIRIFSSSFFVSYSNFWNKMVNRVKSGQCFTANIADCSNIGHFR